MQLKKTLSLQFVGVWLGLCGLLVVAGQGCSPKVPFEHTVTFAVRADSYAPGDGAYTNIVRFISTEDVRGFLKEKGYTEEEFQSLVIDGAVLSHEATEPGWDWLASFTLSISNRSGLQILTSRTNSEQDSFQPGPLSLNLDADSLLQIYRNAPFTMYGLFHCRSAVDRDVRLVISGTVTLQPL